MVALHVLTMVFSVCVVFFADEEAFAWMIGRKQTLNKTRVAILHWLTWVGLATLVGSGLYLALPQLTHLLTQPLFIMKLLFVAILLINAVLIGRFSDIATERSFASLTWEETLPLFTSGAVSLFAWLGAIVLALLVFG